MSDDNIISFNKEKAFREGDSTKWTIVDALEHCIEKIKAGEYKPEMVFIAFVEEDKDGHDLYYSVCAGGCGLEYAGLLANHLSDITAGRRT